MVAATAKLNYKSKTPQMRELFERKRTTNPRLSAGQSPTEGRQMRNL